MRETGGSRLLESIYLVSPGESKRYRIEGIAPIADGRDTVDAFLGHLLGWVVVDAAIGCGTRDLSEWRVSFTDRSHGMGLRDSSEATSEAQKAQATQAEARRPEAGQHRLGFLIVGHGCSPPNIRVKIELFDIDWSPAVRIVDELLVRLLSERKRKAGLNG